MPRKKKLLDSSRGEYQNKNTSRDKEKMSNIALNSIALQNQYSDLQLKFKLKDLRIILHDIAVDKTISPCTKSFVNKNMNSPKVIDKCKICTNNKKISPRGKESFVNSIVNTECSNRITSHAIAIGKHDTDDCDIQTKPLNIEEQETCFHRHIENLSNFASKSNKEKKKRKTASDVGYTIKSKNIDLIAATDSKKTSNKRIHSKGKKPFIENIVKVVYSSRISSATAKGKHDTNEKITEKQNKDNNFDIQTKLLSAKGQETSFHRHTKVLSNSDSKGSKKKKKRSATNDFGCTLKPKNTDLPADAINSNENINKKTHSRDKKSFVNNVGNTECPNAITSYPIAIGKHGTDEKKQNVDNSFNIQTKALHAKRQKTSFQRHTKGHLISNGKDSKRKGKSRSTKDVYRLKPENTGFPIVSTNNNQNQCLDIYNETGSVTNIDTENKERKENINIYEQNVETDVTNKDLIKDKCSIEQTDEELSKETQKILINLENTNNVYNQNTLEERILPKITEDKILTKNTILLKMQDNVQVTNNSQNTAYCSNVILQNQSNDCLSIAKYSKVADLTEDNLYKFTENYNKGLAPEENVALLNTTANLPSSANSGSTEIILKMNKDTPFRKRGWVTQKIAAETDKTGIKRVKLNRKYIKEKSCTITSSSVSSPNNKNSNLVSKCHSINVNNDKVQNMDSHLTLYSNNGNSLCTIQLASVSPKADCDDTLKSTHVVQKSIFSSSHKILNGESEKNDLLFTEKYHQVAENIVENNLNENEMLSCSTELFSQNQVESKINDNHDDGHNDITGDDINHNNDDGDDNGKKDGADFDNQNNDGGDDNKRNNDDNDDDYISLFAESFSSEYPMAISSGKKANSTLHDYKMTGTTFNNYLQQNILECNRELDTIVENNRSQDTSYQKPYQAKYEEIEQNSTSVFERLSTKVPSIRSINSPVINNNNSSYPDKNYNKPQEDEIDETVMTCTKELEPNKCYGLCKGYCFVKMRYGDCNRPSCYFNHDLQTLIRTIILKYEQYLASIIHYIHCMKYHYLFKKLYILSSQECNVVCIPKLYETIYSMQCSNLEMVCITVEALLNKGMHPKDVVHSLCKVLNSTDTWTPQCIFNSIKEKIKDGEYWDSLRNLFKYVKPTKNIIESILKDCLMTRKNIQDVHTNLIKRLHPLDVTQLDRNLMLSFNNLLNNEYQKTPNKISPKSVLIPNNNDGSSNESYVLRSISDLPEAHSQYRDRFWKLYLTIYNIKEALVHEDYDYVISMLNKYEEVEEKDSLFSRCCFHVLTAEIKHSEYHITKIIEHAVQIGASSILYKVLLDIATCILVKLIIENAWTLAYKLLKTLEVYNLQHNAAFIILSAEIYLANKHAIKALMLIKQSNLISTNRNNWNVASNAQDYYSRTYIINTLLDVLCIKSPEHAFFIFQFLTKDQGNKSQPIDLAHYVDKLMLKLLIEKEIDLIIKMGYIIIEHNFSFFNVTIYRAAIASIVHIDMVLAKQLYQYATGLGIYRTIELLPVIHVIINADWVEEEIYLTFWDLFQRLVMDIGHSIDHLSPARLSVYVIFEIVPTEAHLYCENPDGEQMKKIQTSKNLVRQVLRTRFEPPILPSRKLVSGAIIKLQSKVVINHLKEIYKNYSD